MKIVITKKDLMRETFRCGGKGGQNVNKVETGVRYTYLPLNISAEGREERTQGKNDAIALERLVEKIKQYYTDLRKEQLKGVYNNKKNVSFSSQDRTYYDGVSTQKTKDHRTNIESPTKDVLNGKIDVFIQANLRNL